MWDSDARDQFDEALFAPSVRSRRSPDNVAPEVVDEEMALFRAASATLQTDMRG